MQACAADMLDCSGQTKPQAPRGVSAGGGAHISHVDALIQVNHILALRMHLHQHLVLPHHLYSLGLGVMYRQSELVASITSARYVKALVPAQQGNVEVAADAP